MGEVEDLPGSDQDNSKRTRSVTVQGRLETQTKVSSSHERYDSRLWLRTKRSKESESEDIQQIH